MGQVLTLGGWKCNQGLHCVNAQMENQKEKKKTFFDVYISY